MELAKLEFIFKAFSGYPEDDWFYQEYVIPARKMITEEIKKLKEAEEKPEAMSAYSRAVVQHIESLVKENGYDQR